ncbi:hypothetical protein COCC4DRAFT_30418, partial [Bipolaris maydis ATCC 48331]
CYGVMAHCEHPQWHTICISKITVLQIQRETDEIARILFIHLLICQSKERQNVNIGS